MSHILALESMDIIEGREAAVNTAVVESERVAPALSIEWVQAELNRCVLAVFEQLEVQLRAHKKAQREKTDLLDERLKAAESARQTQGDASAMLLARIQKLEERAKGHDEIHFFIRSNLQAHDTVCAVVRSSTEKVEESVQALAAQMDALRTETQKDQATIAQAQSKAVEEMRAEASQTKKEFEALRTETSKAQEELQGQIATIIEQHNVFDGSVQDAEDTKNLDPEVNLGLDIEPGLPIKSGDYVHLRVKRTGKRISVGVNDSTSGKGDVHCLWHNKQAWESIKVVRVNGDGPVVSGDKVFLVGHWGNAITCDGLGKVHALWSGWGSWQQWQIDTVGGGPIMDNATVFLRAHTSTIMDADAPDSLAGTVQVRFNTMGSWQELVVEAKDTDEVRA